MTTLLGGSKMLQRLEKPSRAPPNKHRFNDLYISRLKSRSKSYWDWDLVQRGLVVKVEPTGTKAFKVFYSRNGRSRWYHLASVNAITVAQARKLANEIMYQVAQGKDPAAERKAMRCVTLGPSVGTQHQAKNNLDKCRGFEVVFSQQSFLLCDFIFICWVERTAYRPHLVHNH
jgi:hypothetical protein